MAEGTKVGSIYYDVDLDDKKLKEGARGVKKELAGIESAFQSAEKGSFLFLGTLTAIGTAASGLITKATLTAARTETLGVAMQSIAKATGTSTEELAKQEAQLKKQGIATQEARSILALFMQSQLDVADAAKIARVAQDLAVIAGKNSSETASILTEAIANQNVVMLRQFGIVTNSTDIFDKYAATLGKSGTELTDMEKRQAFVNKILAEGARVTGTYEAAMETAGKKMGSLDRHIQEALNTIGERFLPVMGLIIDAMTEFLKLITPENVDKFIAKIKELSDWIPVLTGAIVGGLIPALKSLAIATWKAFIAPIIALLPFIAIGALVGATIMGLILIFRKYSEQMREFPEHVETAKQALMGFFQHISEVVTSVLPQAISAVQQFFTNLFTMISTVFMTNVTNFVSVLQSVGATIWGIMQAIAAPFLWVYNNVIFPVMYLISSTVMRVFFEINQFVFTITMEFLNFLVNSIFLPLLNFAITIFTALYNFHIMIWTAIRDFLWSVVLFIKDVIIIPIFTALWGFIVMIWNNVVAVTKQQWEFVKTYIIKPTSDANDAVGDIVTKIKNWIVDTWNGIVQFLIDIGPKIVDGIVKPFREAKAQIERIASEIKAAADKINPFHRESPSLVDNVRMGIDEIMAQYSRLTQLQMPAVAGVLSGNTGTGTQQDINIYIDKVGDMQDISAMGREFGFRAGMLPR